MLNRRSVILTYEFNRSPNIAAVKQAVALRENAAKLGVLLDRSTLRPTGTGRRTGTISAQRGARTI